MFLNVDLCYLYFVSTILMIVYLIFRYKNLKKQRLLSKIPGPSARYPLLGNLDIFRRKGVPLTQSFYGGLNALSVLYEKHGIYKFRLGLKNMVCIFKEKYIEQMLTNSTNLTKSDEYDFLNDWLGQGLLTSKASIWRARRKLLTPAFHFKILEDFLPLINEQTNILLNILEHQTDNEFVNITEFITRCALDIICETAMGISIGAQLDPHQQYVKSIHIVGELYSERVYQPWLWPDFIFYSTRSGKMFRENMNILHGVTRKVIKERKAILLSIKENKDNLRKQENNKEVKNDTIDMIYMSNKQKKRLAFLDLLLDHHIETNLISLEQIREEVDTFMFEGHDTTALAVSWALYILGLHPSIQIKIQEELDSIFGDHINRNITAEHLKSMIYLECVIKESLRLYPSVPLIGRNITEEIQFGDYVIPKGTSVYVLIFRLHETQFIEPLKFDPNRFLPENMQNRNAFSYTPFSAGSRNCIGQKFAIMEEKVMLSKFFLNYNLISLDQRDKIINVGEMVLRPKCPLRVKIVPRKSFMI